MIMPSRGIIALILVGTLFISGLVFTLETGVVDVVTITIQCEDGTTRTYGMEDEQPDDCVRVDADGNYVRYDPSTGEQILVDRNTGERIPR